MQISGKFVPLLVLFIAAALNREALAEKHAVGGSQGWDESTDFDSWAKGEKFQVGDELEFKYTSGLHNVVELAGESAFKGCDIGSSVDSLNGGSNTVKLTKPGTRYFACGTAGHCESGMKVKITTVAAGGSSSSTSGTTSPSASGGGGSSTSAASGGAQFLGFFALIASLVVSFVLYI